MAEILTKPRLAQFTAMQRLPGLMDAIEMVGRKFPQLQFQKSLRTIAALVAALVMLSSVDAMAEELFLGSPLRDASAAGVVVSTFRRNGNGAEVLKIRANVQTAQAFVQAKLPVSPGSRQHDFFLEVGLPADSNRGCMFPDTASQFASCAQGAKKEAWKNWELFELQAINDDIKQMGFQSTSGPSVNARCSYVPARNSFLACEYIFEQGGQHHVLTTSAQALDDIGLFRCAALELRNAIWRGAPPFADTCP